MQHANHLIRVISIIMGLVDDYKYVSWINTLRVVGDRAKKRGKNL